ncbi:MAG: lysophospholipid acyltransferase family protein [Phycisphaerales bacterium JB065]
MSSNLVPNAVLVLLVVLAVAWVLVLLGIAVLKRHAVRWVEDEGGRPALGAAGLVWLIRVYTRWWHRLEAYGMDSIPDLGLKNDVSGRPLGGGRPAIVIANHTAGIDPLLIQASLGFEPRWMMAADMRARVLEPLWGYAKIIFVDRTKRDSASLREAMRHLQAGGALGVFIEGHIAKPPRHLLPFKDGAGLLIKKTGALVIPAVVDGTPQADTAWGSIFRRSHSKVRFLEPVDYTQGELAELGPAEIVADLRARFQRATGWPDTHMQADFDEHGRLVWSVAEGVEGGEAGSGDTGSGDSATLGA